MAIGSAVSDESEADLHRKPEANAVEMDPPLDGMMAEERRTQILQTVHRVGRVKVNELAVHFSTSAVTISNDLSELHQRGLVLRSHGGVVLPDKILRESLVYERLKAYSDEKRRHRRNGCDPDKAFDEYQRKGGLLAQRIRTGGEESSGRAVRRRPPIGSVGDMPGSRSLRRDHEHFPP